MVLQFFLQCRHEETGLPCDCMAGGTAWAVLMAARLGKPVYVFDDEEGRPGCSRRWYRFDHGTGRMVLLAAPPTLPRQFAGIGTRSLGSAGTEAIRKLYERTFGECCCKLCD